MDVPSVEVKALDGERGDGALDDEQRDAEIEEGGDRHVSCDPAEGVEEEELAHAAAFIEEREADRVLVARS
jgi:hypothetical protein